jgi:hypothetical protein
MTAPFRQTAPFSPGKISLPAERLQIGLTAAVKSPVDDFSVFSPELVIAPDLQVEAFFPRKLTQKFS